MIWSQVWKCLKFGLNFGGWIQSGNILSTCLILKCVWLTHYCSCTILLASGCLNLGNRMEIRQSTSIKLVSWLSRSSCFLFCCFIWIHFLFCSALPPPCDPWSEGLQNACLWDPCCWFWSSCSGPLSWPRFTTSSGRIFVAILLISLIIIKWANCVLNTYRILYQCSKIVHIIHRA